MPATAAKPTATAAWFRRIQEQHRKIAEAAPARIANLDAKIRALPAVDTRHGTLPGVRVL